MNATTGKLAAWLATPIGPITFGQHLYDGGSRVAAHVGKVAVVINPKAKDGKPYGFAEHDEHGEIGGIWFNVDKSMSDYDGSFMVALDTAAAIEALGYGVDRDGVSDETNAKADAAGGYLALAKSLGRDVEILTIEGR